MPNAMVGGNLQVAYPESFVAMSDEELRAAWSTDASQMWAIRDPEAHVMIAIAWHDSHLGVLHKLASTKGLAARAERGQRKLYQKGGYGNVAFFERKAAGEEAQGFTYECEIQGVPHVAATLVIKHVTGKDCRVFNVYFYARTEGAEAARAVFNEFVDSLAIV